ncbi:TPA: DUF4091 domain-containing protein [Clostridioides difficile]
MEISYVLKDCTFKHNKYSVIEAETWKDKDLDIVVAKGEKFAFQIMLKATEEFNCTIDKSSAISWKGLGNRVRLALNVPNSLENNFSINILGYVQDDTKAFVNDAILRDKDVLVEQYLPQTFWIEGQVPEDFEENNLDIGIDIFKSFGYEDEEKVCTIDVPVKVRNVVLKPLDESKFFLDLWQHPSCLARMYKVELWSDIHFEIVDNYLKELASLGEKVATVIVSDYPWAGQSCYKVYKNPSNLYEYNMVSVSKGLDGKIKCNFESMDRYISIADKYKMAKEIDLFGLLGNWCAGEFGNPVEGYKDPIRVRYFDEKDKVFKFINNTNDLKEYIGLVLNHLIECGLWDRVRIIADEPNNPEVVKECIEFINSTVSTHQVKYKSATHDQNFLDRAKDEIDDMSINLKLTIQNYKDIESLKKKINDKGGILTWFVCCFPEKPNSFLSSPFVENRIIGWYTYYFGLDGFLRWDYNLWTEDPWKDSSYKFPIWKAGDMFFVYPGKDLKPVRSVRMENLRFGIQDFELFTMLEKEKGREYIEVELMQELLNKKENAEIKGFGDIELGYLLDNWRYDKVKKYVLELLDRV